MSEHNVFRDVPVYLWPVWALAWVASWTIVPVLTRRPLPDRSGFDRYLLLRSPTCCSSSRA